MAKVFPICFLARNMKGIFRIKIRADTEIGVRKEINNEIPVIPPSIKPFGIRKLSSPKPAINIPRIIKKDSLVKVITCPLFIILFRCLIL